MSTKECLAANIAESRGLVEGMTVHKNFDFSKIFGTEYQGYQWWVSPQRSLKGNELQVYEVGARCVGCTDPDCGFEAYVNVQ